MKRVIALVLIFTLILVGCDLTKPKDVTEATTEQSITTQSVTTLATTTDTTTTEPVTTEPTTEAPGPQVKIVSNDLTTLARPNGEDYEEGVQIVSVDDLNTPFIDTPYHAIGAVDPDTGCALAVVQKDDKLTYFVVDQAGNDVEPTHSYTYIEPLKANLYYGIANDETSYVFDHQGVVYGALSASPYEQPVYEPLTNGFYIDKKIYNIDDINKRITKIDGDSAAHYESKYRMLDEQFSISYHETDQSYSYSDGDNVKSIDDYKIVDDYAIIEHDQVESNNKIIRRFGLIKRGSEKILDTDYYAIGHLYGDYFYVATNTIEELEDNFANYRYYDDRSFKKAIYREGEQLTEQLYFNIDHVVNDIFHVFDGETYYFIAAESGQRVWQDINLFANYDFYQVADYIIAVDDPVFTTVMVVIREDAVVARFNQKIVVNNGTVEPRFTGYATIDNHLPVANLSDNEASKTLNSYYMGASSPDSTVDYYSEQIFTTFSVVKHPKLIQIKAQEVYHGFGAAHPGFTVITSVFSAQTGQRYKLADWFKPDANYKEVLADIMLQNKENMSRALFYTEDMTVDEAIENFHFDDVDYYFNQNELVIYYNPYDFASYADGIVEFNIRLRDIEEYLSAEAKVLLLY